MTNLNIRIILIVLLSGCNNPNTLEYPEIDNFWNKYLAAIEQMDKEYLINNSLDSIQCGDCTIEEYNTNEYYNSKKFFNNHLDKLINSAIINNNYSIYENNDTVRINYDLGNYNQIYTLIRTENNYKFQGTFPVP